MLKQILIGIIAISIAFSGLTAASAQEPQRDRPAFGALVLRELIRATAEETGTEPRQVLRARANGQSLNEYITEHNGDPDNVVDSVLTHFDELLTRAVDNGRITEEQKNDMLENAEGRITEAMSNSEPLNLPRPDRPNRDRPNRDRPNQDRPPRDRRLDGDIIGIILNSTGLTAADIRGQFRDGLTLEEIIIEAGADVEAVKAEIIADLTARADEALANGQMTQERYDHFLENIEARITDFLTTPRARTGANNRNRQDAGASQ
ncbi:MAG: hypothetical protein L0154_17830 [Chloroflexi bacterium]|nr:hypothetical protein [Chloroflexota bacterium]